MKSINNPIWLILLTVIPSIILLILGYNVWDVINSQLEDHEIINWYLYSSALCVLTFCVFSYAFWKLMKNEIFGPFISGLIFIAYLIMLSSYSFNSTNLIPWRIPQWMVVVDMSMLVGSFLMPTLLYCMLHIVVWTVSLNKTKSPTSSFFKMLSIPISIYLFSQVILPFWNPFMVNGSEHMYVVMCVLASVAFLFFLLTWVYRLAIRRSLKLNSIAIKVMVSVVMPILGLVLNNSFLGRAAFDDTSGVFGNFNHPWFYGLVLINALFFLLPNSDKSSYRLFRFLGRSITYTYILYFVVVFLPYVPLSLPMVIFFGAGLLMLCPLFLIVFQTKDLYDDFHFLKQYYNYFALSGLMVLGLLIIPSLVTVSYIHDRMIINKALDYAYDSSSYRIKELDINSLGNAINAIKENRKDRFTFLGYSQTPLLSAYYSSVVLDNLTLSSQKIKKLEAIFFDKDYFEITHRISRRTTDVEMKSVMTSSSYDAKKREWTTWLDLEIENNSSRNFAEYVTEIDLPVGAYISDYYLYVEGVKEYGMLTDKKSANWIYNQIRNQNRDPGILSYESGNKVRFKVFPFKEGEIRKTGIQICHKGQVELNIDNEVVVFGDDNIDKSFKIGNTIYLSSQDKEKLPSVVRSPYFHFIVDMSLSKRDSAHLDIDKYKNMIIKNPKLAEGAKVSFVNSTCKTLSFDSDFVLGEESNSYKGGFYLEKAIQGVLAESYLSSEDKYPIIIVNNEDIGSAVLGKGFSNFEFSFPESAYFYSVANDGNIFKHSLKLNPRKALEFESFGSEVFIKEWTSEVGTKVYLKNDNRASVFVDHSYDGEETSSESKWENGLSLQGKWMEIHLYPERAKELWAQIIYGSFKSRVMSPLTSFIVLENEAQRKVLLQKQKQILSGNKNLDLSGDPEEMSEPNFWVLLFVLILLLIIYYWKSVKRLSPHQQVDKYNNS